MTIRWRSSAPYLLVAVVFLLLLAFTHTPNQGDTGPYADDIVRRFLGYPATFWEFGHALWRPLGYVAFRVLHRVRDGGAPGELYVSAVQTLTALSMIGGVIAVVGFFSWLERLGVPRDASIPATILLALSSAFLGYAQTGTAYIPALAMLVLGLYTVNAPDDSSLTSSVVWASFAFAASVLLWLPMVLGVPAAACSGLLLRGDSPKRRRIALGACIGSGMVTIAIYLLIAAAAGLRSVADFRRWMGAASHGISGVGGLSRTLIGFARSLVDMDRLGLVAKRWLLHDPYNPTSFADVMSAGLTRLAALYIILGMLIVLAYLRPAGRRTLGVLLVASVFVLGFAVAWQGGDRERYLALFPMLFLTVALGLTTLRSRIRQAIGLTLVLAAAWLNVPPISRARLAQQCNATARRLSAVPGRSGRDIVVTPHLLDDVAAFSNRCPAAAVMGEHGSPVIYGLVMPHNDFSYAWPDSMRARAERAWANSGHVWIAHRSLAAAPSREWDWAEGDDTRLKWGDFPAFFSQLEFGAPVGGVDGFQELLPTPRNRATLARLADSLSSRTH